MTTELVLHVTTRRAWQAAQEHGEYRAESLASQGFIHFSRRDQILGVANAFYRGRRGLVLLVVDPARLKAELRWEPPDPRASPLTPEGLFPHLYGPLNLDAVLRVLDFEPGADGAFALPPLT